MAKLFESSFDTSFVKPGLSKAVRILNAHDVSVINTIKSGTYSNIWHMKALSNEIGCPISSLYPMVVASLIDRQYMNVKITPTLQQGTSEVVILWTNISNTNLKGWSPTHFNNNNNNNMFKQDDHFSYKNCYQYGSCIKINK